jgi:hypothetical protein
VAGHSDPAHHIDLEETPPVAVGQFEKVLRLGRAEIVDQNIRIRRLPGECAGAVFGREIGRKAFYVGGREKPAHLVQRGRDPLLATAIDNDRRASPRKPFRDRAADTGRRSRNNRLTSREINNHDGSPVVRPN